MSTYSFLDSTKLDSDLTSIANKIRQKLSNNNTLSFPQDFITGINQINPYILGTQYFDQNGTFNASNYNLDGFSEVDVNSFPGLISPIAYDDSSGYVYGLEWRWGGDTVSYSDIYEVEANKSYILLLGGVTGTRFRSIFTTVNILEVPEEDRNPSNYITGIRVVYMADPEPYSSVVFNSTEDGYILVTKDNAGTSGLYSYLIEIQKLVD